jgi:hypothetical protein
MIDVVPTPERLAELCAIPRFAEFRKHTIEEGRIGGVLYQRVLSYARSVGLTTTHDHDTGEVYIYHGRVRNFQ